MKTLNLFGKTSLYALGMMAFVGSYCHNSYATYLLHADYLSTDSVIVTYSGEMGPDALDPRYYLIEGPGSANRYAIPPATVEPVPNRPQSYVLTWNTGYFVHNTTMTLGVIQVDPVTGPDEVTGTYPRDISNNELLAPTTTTVFMLPGQWKYVWGPDDYTDPINPQIYIEPNYTNLAEDLFPGGREHAASWVDPVTGRMWMFGGHVTSDHNGGSGVLNDFWNFQQSPTSNTTGTWELTSGTATYADFGHYPENPSDPSFDDAYPAARHSAVTWVDADDNFWMFGGMFDNGTNTGTYNDLWKFELDATPTGGTWIWMGQSDTYDNDGGAYPPNYDQPGMPAARQNAMSWTDNNGVLWLFGGTDDNGSVGHFNDLWKYEIDASGTTGTWTLISGDEGLQTGDLNYPAVQGVPGGSPSAREGSATYVDNQGNLWLFGGTRINDTTGDPERLNDLWKYDPVTGEWTWMTGSSTGNDLGDFELDHREQGTPAARADAGFWVDDGGRFYLLGGKSIRPTLADPGVTEEWYSNDMWRYEPDPSGETNGAWTWVAGVSYLSNLGIYPLPDTDKGYPWATAGPVVWVDNEGDFWLFGGESSNSLLTDPFTSSIHWTWDGMFGGGVPICVSGSSYVSRNTITLTYTGPMGGGVNNPMNYTLQGTGAGPRLGTHPFRVTQVPGTFTYMLQWPDGEFIVGGTVSVDINTDDIVDAWGNGICVSPTNNLIIPPDNLFCTCPPLP